VSARITAGNISDVSMMKAKLAPLVCTTRLYSISDRYSG
jgi:hypothetical protein